MTRTVFVLVWVLLCVMGAHAEVITPSVPPGGCVSTSCTLNAGDSYTATGGTAAQTLGTIGFRTYNPLSYEAKCDWVNGSNATDDTAAINAMFTAIRSANVPFKVYTPENQICYVTNSINATAISGLGNNLSPGSSIQLRVACQTAGRPCVDALGSKLLDWDHVYIFGFGNSTVSTTSAAVGTGAKSLTVATGLSWPTVGSNVAINSAVTPYIYMLGTVTSYNSGTGALVVNVATANGSGTLASWSVSTVPSYGIQIGRTSTATASIHSFFRPVISGKFSVAAAYNLAAEETNTFGAFFDNVFLGGQIYGTVVDAYNHFNIQSQYASETLPVDSNAGISTLGVRYYGSWLGALGTTGLGVPVWIGGGTGATTLDGTYTPTNGPNCIVLYEMDPNVAPGILSRPYFKNHCENANVTDAILVTGTRTTPVISGLTYIDDSPQNSNSLIKTDTGITAITCEDCTLHVDAFPTNASAKLFDNGSLWTFAGDIYLPSLVNWTAPAAGAGRLCVAATCYPYVPTTPINRNPDFIIDQVGEGAGHVPSFATATIVDGWHANIATLATNTISWARQSNAPPGYTYSMTGTVNATFTVASTAFNMARSMIEAPDIITPLQWGTASAQPITVSYCLKSSTAGNFAFPVITNPSLGLSYVHDNTLTAPATWQCFSTTVPGPTSGTWLVGNDSNGALMFLPFAAGSSFNTPQVDSWQVGTFYNTSADFVFGASTSPTLSISAVHVYPGPIVPPYLIRPLAQEWNLARRFYNKSFQSGTAPAQNAGAINAATFVAPYANATFGSAGRWVDFGARMWNQNNSGAVPVLTFFSTSAASANCYDATQAGDTGAASAINEGNQGFYLSCVLTGGKTAALGDQIQVQWTAESIF